MNSGPVIVRHALGSYPVYVQVGALGLIPQVLEELLPGRRVVMIADALVSELYQSGRLVSEMWAGETVTFPPGEKSKTREWWARLTDELMNRGFGRDSAIVALGGGVTGDLAGFVAATYLRGIPYVQVPTTLLAMVDASVGGKTGVDTAHGKNLVGAFHPPVAVLADPRSLSTLDEREYRNGLPEAVKHGLIADEEYFSWIEANVPALKARDLSVLAELVRRSVEIKGSVVSDDERESGRRAILNAGHTVAHAVEQASGYRIPHGEAVALGLLAESRLAEKLGVASAGLEVRVRQLLISLGLPGALPVSLRPAELLGSMARDKKNREGRIHFALPTRIGHMDSRSGWTTSVRDSTILLALEAIF
jgi:3-dehydroquinate synthase